MSAERRLELAAVLQSVRVSLAKDFRRHAPDNIELGDIAVDDRVRRHDGPAVDVCLQDHRPAGDPHVVLDHDRDGDGDEVRMVHVVREPDDMRVTGDPDVVTDRMAAAAVQITAKANGRAVPNGQNSMSHSVVHRMIADSWPMVAPNIRR
jgi:hypothetical protein